MAELRPDCRALVVAVEGLRPGPCDLYSEELLSRADATAADPEEHPHIAARREAFRAFGAKPKRTRPSVDALLRRAPQGLPRVDRLTDVYNAVSLAHVLPVGGEDLDGYEGPARLVRAEGTEPFEASAGGDPAAAPPFTGRCRVRPVNDRRGSRPPVRRELSGQQVELPTLTERTERVMSDAFLPAPTVATGEPAHPVRSYSRTVDDSRL